MKRGLIPTVTGLNCSSRRWLHSESDNHVEGFSQVQDQQQ